LVSDILKDCTKDPNTQIFVISPANTDMHTWYEVSTFRHGPQKYCVHYTKLFIVNTVPISFTRATVLPSANGINEETSNKRTHCRYTFTKY